MPTRCPGRRQPSWQGDDNHSKSWHLSAREGTGNQPEPPLPSARLPSRFWPALEADQTPAFPDAGWRLPKPQPHPRCPGTFPAVRPRRTPCGLPGTPTWEGRETAHLSQPGPQGTLPSFRPPFRPQQNQVGRSLPRSIAPLPIPLANPKLPRGVGAEIPLTAANQQPTRRYCRGGRTMARSETGGAGERGTRSLVAPGPQRWPRPRRGRGLRGPIAAGLAGEGGVPGDLQVWDFPRIFPDSISPGSLRTRWERGWRVPGRALPPPPLGLRRPR